jgi:arylformamidase
MNVIDISLQLGSDYKMQTPEGVKNVQLEFEVIKDYPGGMGQYVTAVHMRLHNGTHVDAPKHFVEGGASVDQIPLSTFIGDAVLFDFTHIGENQPITAAEFEKAAAGREIAGKRILLRTNWNRNYGADDYKDRSPFFGKDAVPWILERKPVLVGYDFAHAKDDPDVPFEAYYLRSFLENGICTMGYLRNLDQIDQNKSVLLSALPLAFIDVESSPVRAVVLQD